MFLKGTLPFLIIQENHHKTIMKSIQIVNPGEVRLIETPKPSLSNNEVLIKVAYVGFCGSDLSSYLGRNPMVSYPVIPGHEVAGTIVDKGNDVPGYIQLGQRITLIPYTSCGECASCRRGRPNACQHNQTLGVQRDGAMSEYFSIPWEKVLPVDGLSMEELALAEPLTVGFHAISRGMVTENDTVAILGCGIIGIGAIISALNKKARVTAVDIDDSKLDLAVRLGASNSINAGKEDLAAKLQEIGGGIGPDVIIEAAGQPATYQAAIENVSFTGRVVCVGYAKEKIAFATKLFVQKELDILGSRNASQTDFKDVLDYLGKKKLPVDELISMKIRPEEASEAMKKWAENPGSIFKILVGFPNKAIL